MFYVDVLQNTTPEFSDLYRNIVPKYAARWKDLGIQLKLPVHNLDVIAIDHVNHPSYSEECCKAMLKKWMQVNFKPTWDELYQAIDGLPLLSDDGNSKSMYVCM